MALFYRRPATGRAIDRGGARLRWRDSRLRDLVPRRLDRPPGRWLGSTMWGTDSPRVLERVEGRLGELVLRADGTDFEVISNGVFLMDTHHPWSRPCRPSALRKDSATGVQA